MFVIISGSSGVGKNTIISELVSADKRFVNIPSYTTRGIREGEVEGKYYFYISVDEFEQKYKKGEIVEKENVHGNLYGMSAKCIKDAIASHKIIVKDVGVEGALNLQKSLSSKYDVITIFLTATKDTLRQRLKERGEIEIEKRLARYDYEQQFISNYDYVIENIDKQATIERIEEIVDSEIVR